MRPTYYSRAIPTPRIPRRRRARHGSLERPVNGRLYRGTWLLVGLPLLLAAFTLTRSDPLPAPRFPPTFDPASAIRLASHDLPRLYPDRSPGTPGALGAASWFSDQLAPYGLQTDVDVFQAIVPGRGRVTLRNVIAVSPGRSPDTIVVMAHRDNTGTGEGANDNASGTAALIELARAYARTTTGAAAGVRTEHTLLFLSTDAGAFGGLGAAHFAARSPYRSRVVAVVNLDSLASRGRARLEIAGERARSPAPLLVQTAAARIEDETNHRPGRTSVLGQLVDLGFPFSLYEQAPFIGHGIPAVTLTTGGNRPPSSSRDTAARFDGERLVQLGRAAEALVASLDAGLELTRGTSSYVYFGTRFLRGWALELVLIAMLFPPLFAAVDLFARCRRRRIRLAPAFRSYRSRLAFWLWAGGLFGVFALAGAFPGGAARPLGPETHAAGQWPRGVLAGLAVLLLASWLVARGRLVPRRHVTREEELAGYIAALLVLGVVALLVVATNPFALVFVLPSLHAWLWLPNARGRRRNLVRAALVLAGLSGPCLLLGSFGFRFGLGLDAPWYLAELTAIGYVPVVAVLLFLTWLAGAAQIVAVSIGRYAPYPSVSERPPRGPIRNAVRAVVLGIRARRRTDAEAERQTLGA